jgi:hypothetical protein
MLSLLYDWLIVPPADVLGAIIILPIMMAPLFATIAAWFFVVFIFEGKSNGSATRAWTVLIAGMISGYVLLVTMTTVIRLPHTVHEMLARGDE